MIIFWFRRDLRLNDNQGLYYALRKAKELRLAQERVQPIFIFDKQILGRLHNKHDRRVQFIYQQIIELDQQLRAAGSKLWVFYGETLEVFETLFSQHSVQSVFLNHDYEPEALIRDQSVQKICEKKGIAFSSHKDQVIFEKYEVLTDAQKTYTVFTPYSKKWLSQLQKSSIQKVASQNGLDWLRPSNSVFQDHDQVEGQIPSLEEMGFQPAPFEYPAFSVSNGLLIEYAKRRDTPAVAGTSRLGLHLRFGTISVRELVFQAQKTSSLFLSELIWREFFMQILFHFPEVVGRSFRPQYENISWLNDQHDFNRWSEGQTGFPLVDAGIRELLETGHMHNRVRMVVASFMTKHLLIHWSLGERFFARHLLDFELASNNGNWQWAAGTGCDAAPYFRIFNPQSQLERFDPQFLYVKRWVPEWGTSRYPQPMVDHSWARERALRVYKKGLGR